jgi:hypothetical protein
MFFVVSAYDVVTGGRNDVFAGELLEEAGIHYYSSRARQLTTFPLR